MQEEKLSLIIKILDKLVGVVDVISLTGGEPLVVPYFDELLEEISNRNFKIYLSTNGYLLKEHLDPIVKNVDIVGLPIDSINNKINHIMARSDEMLKITLDNIEKLKTSSSNIVVKVGTVVTKANINELESLGCKILDSYYSADYWRVYQFTAYGKAIDHYDDFFIADETFTEISLKLKKKFKDRVSFLSSENVKECYFFITPDLKLALLNDINYETVLDLMTASTEEIINIIKEKKNVVKSSNINRKHLEILSK